MALVGAHRLHGAPGSIQRQHVHGDQTFPQRVRGNEDLEIANGLRMAPACELVAHPSFDGDEIEIFQASALRHREPAFGQIGQNIAAPQGDGVYERPGRDALLEPPAVQHIPGDVHGVAAGDGSQGRPPDDLAQAGDVLLKGLSRRGWRRPAQTSSISVSARTTRPASSRSRASAER